MCDTLTMLFPIFKKVTQPKLAKPTRLVVFLPAFGDCRD
jgi:hypothetical protein